MQYASRIPQYPNRTVAPARGRAVSASIFGGAVYDSDPGIAERSISPVIVPPGQAGPAPIMVVGQVAADTPPISSDPRVPIDFARSILAPRSEQGTVFTGDKHFYGPYGSSIFGGGISGVGDASMDAMAAGRAAMLRKRAAASNTLPGAPRTRRVGGRFVQAAHGLGGVAPPAAAAAAVLKAAAAAARLAAPLGYGASRAAAVHAARSTAASFVAAGQGARATEAAFRSPQGRAAAGRAAAAHAAAMSGLGGFMGFGAFAGSATLQMGATGQAVTDLQTALKNLGTVVNVSGTFDANTKIGVNWLKQKAAIARGLQPVLDGVMGPDEWVVLDALVAKAPIPGNIGKITTPQSPGAAAAMVSGAANAAAAGAAAGAAAAAARAGLSPAEINAAAQKAGANESVRQAAIQTKGIQDQVSAAIAAMNAVQTDPNIADPNAPDIAHAAVAKALVETPSKTPLLVAALLGVAVIGGVLYMKSRKHGASAPAAAK
jgi:hypothetical protein